MEALSPKSEEMLASEMQEIVRVVHVQAFDI